jgi:cytochrome P450
MGTSAVNDFIARHGRNAPPRLPLARLIAGNREQGVPPLPDAQIADEVTIILYASTDTTATTLTYLCFELARHPEWYACLRAEARAAFAAFAAAGAARAAAAASTAPTTANTATATTERAPDGRDRRALAQLAAALPPYAVLRSLPVLNAVLWETLRMYPPMPGGQQRVVPGGGAPVAGAGGWLPAGTAVFVPTYTIQRDASAFPQPDEWQPARWLAAAAAPSVPLFPSSLSGSCSPSAFVGQPAAANVEKGAEGWTIYETEGMREHMLVFSNGARRCLGKVIALMELKLVTAAIAQRFASVRLGDAQQTVDDMRLADHIVLTPKGNRCELVFD